MNKQKNTFLKVALVTIVVAVVVFWLIAKSKPDMIIDPLEETPS